MTIKVLLTGIFASGKTTLCRELARVPGVAVVPEVARDLLDRALELQERPEFQGVLLREQLRRERAGERRRPAVLVCDRGTIDVTCYCRFYGHPEPAVPRTHRPCDMVFVCSPDGIEPGSRLDPPARLMRRRLHDILIDLLVERGICFEILHGLPSTRAARMLQRLGDELPLGVARRRSGPESPDPTSRERRVH